MFHHFLTRYAENGVWFAEAWIQLNILNKCFCFSRRRMQISA